MHSRPESDAEALQRHTLLAYKLTPILEHGISEAAWMVIPVYALKGMFSGLELW